MDITNFRKDPRYIRYLHVLNSMDSDRRALIDSALLDKQFAGTYMGEMLAGMDQDRQQLYNRSTESLGAQRLGLLNKQYDYAKEESGEAQTLGWTNVAAGGLTGFEI